MDWRFFDWLGRAYGIGEERYRKIEREDPEWAESLIHEWASVMVSWGMKVGGEKDA